MELIKFIDKYGHTRKGIPKKCPICEKEFMARKDRLEQRCCSVKCKSEYKTLQSSVLVECANCKKEFNKVFSTLANSKSGFYFCCRKCKDNAQRIGGIKEIMPPHYGISKNPKYRTLFEEKEFVCSRCGYNEFMCSVEIHHIDRDRENNKKENLIPLCACCHAALHAGYWELDELNF